MVLTISLWIAGLFVFLLVVAVLVTSANMMMAAADLAKSLSWLSSSLQFRGLLLSVARGVVLTTTADKDRQPAAIAEVLGVDLQVPIGGFTAEGYQIMAAWKQAQEEMNVGD